MRSSSEAGRGVEEWGPRDDRGRILGQLVETRALAVVVAVTMAVTVSMDEVLETHRGHENVCHRGRAVAIAVDVAMVSYWWHTVTVDKAMKDCHEDVKLAGCW